MVAGVKRRTLLKARRGSVDGGMIVEITAPPGVLAVKVLVTAELIELLGNPETTRMFTKDGRPITVSLGEPDDDGFYSPIFHEGGS